MDEADLLGDRYRTVLPVLRIRYCPKPGAAFVAVMLPCRYAVAVAVVVAKADAVAVAPNSGYATIRENIP